MSEKKQELINVEDAGLTPITKETVRAYLCPLATDQDLALVLNICKATGMNPFVKDVEIIKYDKSKPAQIVTRKDWFFKTANSQPSYEGMDHGVIVSRNGEIVYQKGAFKAPSDTLLGGWAEVYVSGKRPHRAEVTLSEYDKNQSNWLTMKATMINKVAKVHALRESFPEKFQGIIDESEIGAVIEASFDTEKPVIEMPTKKAQTPEPIEIKTEPAQEIKSTFQPLVCTDCENAIRQEEKDYSVLRYKKPLCRLCQKNYQS